MLYTNRISIFFLGASLWISAAAVTAVGMRSLHGDSSQDNVQAPDPDQKLYSQERTGGGAYADRDDPKAQGERHTARVLRVWEKA